jgi:hypothetical protein
MIGGETRRMALRRAFLRRQLREERLAQLHREFEAALAARRLARAERQSRAHKGAATKRQTTFQNDRARAEMGASK